MFLMHGNAKYMDVLERTMYNAALSGISMEGDRFFYPNVLESIGQYQRSPWFGCACCPSNVARFIPSIPGFAHASKGKDVYVNLLFRQRCNDRAARQSSQTHAVLGATLIGIDKSQAEHDYVRMCEAWFNSRNQLNLVLNLQWCETGGSFWYEIWPHIVFYALADRYPDS